MLLFDVSVTSHCEAHSGVQQVARSLYKELSKRTPVYPICYDPYAKHWRGLDDEEAVLLEAPKANSLRTRRRTRWTLSQRLRGQCRRMSQQAEPLAGTSYSGLVVPEIFSEVTGEAYDALFARVTGPKVALFHDLIPITHPQWSSQSTVARFPQYLEVLRGFDAILANSEHTRKELERYWQRQGFKQKPRLDALHLGVGIDRINASQGDVESTSTPKKILSVGTFEGRKNQLTLLRAAEQLWAEDRQFELVFVGVINRETGGEALRYLRRLEKRGLPVSWLSQVSEARLNQLYQEAYCTVYPSLVEGFGLPILESLAFGKPCLCYGEGAVAEVAGELGCLQTNVANVGDVAESLRELLTNETVYKKLCQQAETRDVKSWTRYTDEFLKWFISLEPVDRYMNCLH